MELDDFKNMQSKGRSNKPTEASTQEQTTMLEIEKVKQDFKAYSRKYSMHVYLEITVAVFAFASVVTFIAFGDVLYQKIISELMPNYMQSNANRPPEIHGLMTFAMWMMAAYCVVIPWKMYQTTKLKNLSAEATTQEHVSRQLQYFKNMKQFWSTSFLWSILPANIIGLSFFWGLQISLLDTWVPSIYLIIYIIALILYNWFTVILKRQLLNKEVKSRLDELDELTRCFQEQ
jgi:uncharacterized membrane protein YhaH (DUF805 family)